MGINENNFVAGDKEDVVPSYVDAVLGNHDINPGAHPDIRKQIADAQAFYQGVKDHVQGVADAARSSAESASRSVNSAGELVDEARENAEKAALAAEKYPYIGENGNWYVWDSGSESFVDSGVCAAGYTPQKGVHYWTEEDKAEMIADVLAALPVAEEVAY